jgi:N4-gp56 family major capsid protein
MAQSQVATGLTVKQWDDEFFMEYMQDNAFTRYMGTKENAIIQVKEDLKTKKGNKIAFALVNRLRQDPILGSSMLEGNEEALVSRSHEVTINQRRNGVLVPDFEDQKSAIDLREAARAALKDWTMEDTRDLIIEALASVCTSAGVNVAYASATEAEKDAWLVDNADRVLFGAVKSNNSSNDHSASLANVDGTTDKFLPAALKVMKRMALTASPKIRPITVEGGKRFFVAFAHPYCFRDFNNDDAIKLTQRDTIIRMQNIKLFEGGDAEIDGIIVHEVDDIPVLDGVGAAAIDVAPVFLCGAQALGMAWGKRWQTKTKLFDYDDKYGVAVRAWMDVDKLFFGSGAGDTTDPKQNGVVTGYFACVADS